MIQLLLPGVDEFHNKCSALNDEKEDLCPEMEAQQSNVKSTPAENQVRRLFREALGHMSFPPNLTRA